MAAKRVTMAEVAKEAGVSIKTVSNAINGVGNVLPKTQKKVDAAVAKLGYRIDTAARYLKTRKHQNIGLAIGGFDSPFYTQLLEGVIEESTAKGYTVTISTYNQLEGGVEELIREAPYSNADGWIVYASHPLADEGKVLEGEYPIVQCGNYTAFGKADLITLDNRGSFRETTQLLLDRGCTRIAALCAPEGITRDTYHRKDAVRGAAVIDRLEGYIDALRDNGVDVDWSLIPDGRRWTMAGGASAVDDLLGGAGDGGAGGSGDGARPDAILCYNDSAALGALYELQLRGVSVPGDVQVIGFDNIAESQYSSPSLTTVDPMWKDYARMCVTRLIARINGDDSPYATIALHPRLVERDSTKR
ncbi:LacI family DNA-binding transcriptional regulator [Bifidobacterium avesanii]|uniref:LacI family DNA-binding transcriptional regulator n=1 Tax=Bifidobacterium avesanii TaxID=1798157 RepID=A0A7K3TK45_9BIFI|nr:LacI family DNA-binding transcriptional regulator [Bifidobacterium avesanii]KAB8289741.1 LacI family transcriptional regulator [Bifidobacterium avesanii]NEG79099.1 LacI family DNA-binding transcriptional regulator [Bifidobacterium avesanii]